MNITFRYRHTTLHAQSEGSGFPIVLLHGYLESQEVWDPFAHVLASRFRVIRMDLPGHGKSGILAPVHTMELLADAVKALLDVCSIKTCLLVGHSMGGYASLAFAQAYEEKLAGLCLFHSTPFADTQEKKMNRDREIALIQQGKKSMLVQTNIPKGFANDNLNLMSGEVARVTAIALATPDEGIVALLEGMKQRADHSQFLRNFAAPVLWILGEKDNYIPYPTIRDTIQLNPAGQLAVLKNSGHMGFLEEPDTALQHLTSFALHCINADAAR